MQPRLHALILLFSIFVILVLLELIRRGRLREEYSLIWLFSAVSLITITVFKGSLRALADFLEVEYAPSLIFMVGIVFLMAIQLAQTLAVSKLTTQNRDLAQKYGILALELENHAREPSPVLSVETVDAANQYLQWIGQQLRLCPQFPVLMQRALELTAGSFSTPNGSLLVVGEEGRLVRHTLIYQGAIIADNGHDIDDTLREGLSGWVMDHRKPTLVSSTMDDERWLKRPWEAALRGSRSAMSVPLEFNEHLDAVLTLVHPNPGKFSEKDLGFLMGIAGVISTVGGEILAGQRVEEPAISLDGPAIVPAGRETYTGEFFETVEKPIP